VVTPPPSSATRARGTKRGTTGPGADRADREGRRTTSPPAPAPATEDATARSTRRSTRRSAQAAEPTTTTSAAAAKKTRSGARAAAAAAAGGGSGGGSGGGAGGRTTRARRARAVEVAAEEEEEMEEKEEKGGPDDDDDDEGEPTPATAEDGGDGDFDADAEEEEDDDAVSESEYDPSSQPATNANDSRNALRAEVVDLLDDTAEEMDDDAGDVRWGGIARKRAKKAAAAATNGERRNATATNATTPGSSGRGQTQKCPICSSMILEGLMNSHIDVCLTKGQAGASAGGSGGNGNQNYAGGNPQPFASANGPASAAAIPKLPKLVYHIMKDKPLKKLLAEANLSTAGTRAQMIERHKEYTLRVNTSIECGVHPNLEQVARDVDKLERDKARAGMMTAAASNGLTGAVPTAASAANAKSDTFSRLIASVRERQPAKENKRPSSSGEDDTAISDGDEGAAGVVAEVGDEDVDVVGAEMYETEVVGAYPETEEVADDENDDRDDDERTTTGEGGGEDDSADGAVADSWHDNEEYPLSQMPPRRAVV